MNTLRETCYGIHEAPPPQISRQNFDAYNSCARVDIIAQCFHLLACHIALMHTSWMASVEYWMTHLSTHACMIQQVCACFV
jgi:hypothetical protein